MHTGVDLRAEEGQPVYAAADGRVVGFFDDDINGYGILIHHPSSTGQPSARTAYIHLRDRPTHKMHDLVWAPATWRVPWGVSRPPCLPIGYAGSTGRSTGPHLHMEIRILDISWHRADPLTVIDFSPYTIEYK